MKIAIIISFTVLVIVLTLIYVLVPKKSKSGFRYEIDTWSQKIYLYKDGVEVGMEPYEWESEIPAIKKRLLKEYHELKELIDPYDYSK